MINTEKYIKNIYTNINLFVTFLYTIEAIRYFLTCLNYGKNSLFEYMTFASINLSFILSYLFNKNGKHFISKHIFYITIILLFTKLSIFKINFFLPRDSMVLIPLLLSLSFPRRRYIMLYSAVLVIILSLVQLNYKSFSESEYSSIVITTVSITSFCLLYKVYTEKINAIQKESYFKLYNATFSLLGKVSELKDDETQNHQERVGLIINILLRRMKKSSKYSNKITPSYMQDVIHGSYLHDIGKIAINDSILLKKGKYTKDEFNEMKNHTLIGADLLVETQEKAGIKIYDTAVDIVKYHHERWDGQGYPEGLEGEKIPLAARIMAVADVYDALISKRRYKKAFSHDEAYSIITDNSAKHFDPDIVKCFKKTHQNIYSTVKTLL